MQFNSITYFIFLPVLFLVFYLAGHRFRWQILLLGSFIFYGFLLKPLLVAALILVTLLSSHFGRIIDSSRQPSTRKKLLWLGISADLFLLIYFKYLPFLTENLNLLLKLLYLDMTMPVPAPQSSIALSFFVFQAISYLADIYFRMAKPEPHLGYLALYLSFFPKLLQGPIERSAALLPQLKAQYEFNYDNMRSGMLLLGWGLFKKVVVADRLALYVNPVYNDVHAYTGLPLAIATYAYALQIYFDFSGYTDMARGTARMFGVNLTDNFNSPYLATSCADFWRRWHISLSRWILDYIFEPLQMKFRHLGKVGTAFALMVTFLVCGIWHGASWCFITWGLLHGCYLVASTLYKPCKKRVYGLLRLPGGKPPRIWQILFTFHLVCFTFIFFRSNSVQDAVYIIKGLVMPGIGLLDYMMIYGETSLVIVISIAMIAFIIDACKNNAKLIHIFNSNTYARWPLYYVMTLSIIFMQVDADPGFIYFKF